MNEEINKVISASIDKGVELGAWNLAKKISIVIELSRAGDAITIDDIKMMCDDAIEDYRY